MSLFPSPSPFLSLSLSLSLSVCLSLFVTLSRHTHVIMLACIYVELHTQLMHMIRISFFSLLHLYVRICQKARSLRASASCF